MTATRTRTSHCNSSSTRTVLSECKILHFCKTLTSPLHFHLCASRQQGKQQWFFIVVYHLVFCMIYHIIVRKQTQAHMIHLLTRNQGVSPIPKRRILVLPCGRLNSLIILSWLHLGINRNPRNCIYLEREIACYNLRSVIESRHLL